MAARPAVAVSAGSGAADPRAACRDLPAPLRILFHQVGASPPEMVITSQRSSSQVKGAPIGICAVSPTYSRIRVRTARRKRYAFAAVETDTPWSKSAARHSRIIGVDSLPTGTPPRRGVMCFLSSHR